MENDPSNQKTVNGYDYNELLKRLNNGEDLSYDELQEILWYVLFKVLDNSADADKKDNSRGLRVSFYSLVGQMGGRSTKFLPYTLDYRKKAFDTRKKNYDEVDDGYAITQMNLCRENIEVLVKQLELADLYSDDYRKLSGEIEDSIESGVKTFACPVGMDTMIQMDEIHDKVLALSKKYKKL